MKSPILAFTFVLTVFVSDVSPLNAQTFDLEKTLQHLKVLSSDEYQGRGNGMEGGEMARTYILKEFESLELEKFGEHFVQDFQFYNRIKKEKRAGQNIIGWIKGKKYPEKYFVISAHYDHLGIRKGKIYNGADDNGSGTAALFAIAAYFTQNQPDHSIIIAAFDAEEMGLQGAKHFVEEPIVALENILLNVNMDMIGRNVNNEIYICGTYHYPQLKKPLKKIAKKSKLRVLFGHDQPNHKILDDWTRSSDHGPFHKKKIPFLYFGEEDHPDYHQPGDDFENIMPEFYGHAITLVIRSIKQMDKKIDKL